MASLTAQIYNYAVSPYDEWQAQAGNASFDDTYSFNQHRRPFHYAEEVLADRRRLIKTWDYIDYLIVI